MRANPSIFLTLLIAVTTNVVAQDKDFHDLQGIGFLRVQPSDSLTLVFYEVPLEHAPKQTLAFAFDSLRHHFVIENEASHRGWLQPEYNKLDYQMFVLRCTSQKEGWYEVMVNKGDPEFRLWLKDGPHLTFQDWESFLQSMFSVERIDPATHPIRQSPGPTAPTLDFKNDDCLRVRRIQGEWLEVFVPDDCARMFDIPIGQQIKSGWIIWRSAKRLLIRYNPFG